ncbi:MAG: proline racemase [Bacteroidetes bacterium HGW-Bacteroidetes-17]|jgi:trans-L-3-hydroxyproline dehydratase|nr:MAG: proline racemase [Bacteroidetes bacterium HGW-Bacteroidetes-17]
MELNWIAPDHWKCIETIDAHTAGEPLRIFTKGLPEIKGSTVLERRRYFRENYDHLRTSTMFEPRGHADMYGAILIPPNTPDADFGVFFIHNEGYSTMCGHAIIALSKILPEIGLVEKNGDEFELKIDAPAGRIHSKVKRFNGKFDSVSFRNVPSFVLMKDQEIKVEGIGIVNFDIAYGGAFYAFVDADKIGLGLQVTDYNQIIDWGKRIKNAVMQNFEIKHPFEEDLSFLYGTIFTGKANDSKNHSRNVCVFAEGEVDRSPTGTGVSARAAIHYFRKEIGIGESIRIESILDTCFEVKVVEEVGFGGHHAVIPEVIGNAYITGQHKFYFDPEDPLVKGFIFR